MASVGEGDTLRAQDDKGAGDDIMIGQPDKNPWALNASLLELKKLRNISF